MAKKVEEFSIKTNTNFDKKAYVAMVKDSVVTFAIVAILGIALIITFAILYPLTNYNRYIVLIFVPGLLFLLVAIIYFFLIIRNYFAVKAHPLNIEYAFFKDKMNEISYRENEKVEESIIEYDSFIKYKMKKEYLFLYLYNKRCVPIEKDENIEEILKIIDLSKLKRKIF